LISPALESRGAVHEKGKLELRPGGRGFCLALPAIVSVIGASSLVRGSKEMLISAKEDSCSTARMPCRMSSRMARKVATISPTVLPASSEKAVAGRVAR